MIESLESRRLLHGTSLIDGLLVLRGENGIRSGFSFTQDSTTLTVTASEDGQAEEPQPFLASAVRAVLVYGADLADTIDLGNMDKPTAVDAGKGNDTVTGGAGRDTIKGNSGNDSLDGGDNDDLIDGGRGGDTMAGGGGRDIVDYRSVTDDITVILGTDDNGVEGERDVVSTTFEIIRGGSGDDFLSTTSSRGVTLLGGAGDDTLVGGRGNDALDGNVGLDFMQGNAGDDSFYAQDGMIERLEGGPGTDVALSRDKKDRLIDIP